MMNAITGRTVSARLDRTDAASGVRPVRHAPDRGALRAAYLPASWVWV